MFHMEVVFFFLIPQTWRPLCSRSQKRFVNTSSAPNNPSIIICIHGKPGANDLSANCFRRAAKSGRRSHRVRKKSVDLGLENFKCHSGHQTWKVEQEQTSRLKSVASLWKTRSHCWTKPFSYILKQTSRTVEKNFPPAHGNGAAVEINISSGQQKRRPGCCRVTRLASD